MNTTFYYYVQTLRDTKNSDARSEIAQSMFNDLSFPKQATDYHSISDYLETHVDYIDDMTLFDQLWEMYQENIQN